MVDDVPRRPAVAYYTVAEILGDTYFLREPPPAGVRMTVTADDGVPTQWDVSEPEASMIRGRVPSKWKVLASPYRS